MNHHGIIELAVARPLFRYFMPLGPRKNGVSLGYKIKAKNH
jgi:hypothetical protein